MSTSNWLLYVTVVLLSTVTPGPAVLLSMSNALAQGPRAAVFSSMGNIAGLLLLSGVAVAGIGTVLQTSTVVFLGLKVSGAAYLVYLGIRRWSESMDVSNSDPMNAAFRAPMHLFTQGALMALTNPKAILFFVALYPQFVDTEKALVPQFLLLTGTLMLSSFAALMAYALLANSARVWLSVGQRNKAFHRLSGAAFVLLGIFMLGVRNSAA